MSSFLKNIHPLLARKQTDNSDTNFAILSAIESVLADTEKETLESKRQSSLKTATDKYLDIWGDWFGVYRRDGESDSRYRRRIIGYLDMPRGTNQAIRRAVRRYLADPNVGVEIYEPYNDILTLNKSKLNGSHGLMGDYFRFAVIQVNIGRPFDDDLIDYLYRFTPSGVRVHVNYDPSLPRRNDTDTNVSASLFTMTPFASEAVATRYSGLEAYIGGRIQLRDQDAVLADFINNNSNLNSEDVLTGSFTKDRELYHVFGRAMNLRPRRDSRMGNLLGMVEEMEESEYINTTNQTGGTTVTSINVNPSEEVYMMWNIDHYLYKKYFGSKFKLDRTKEEFASVLEGSAFTMTTKSNNRGATFDLQAYNFTVRRWVTLKREVTNGRLKTFHASLVNPIDFLNNNRLMVTRIRANNTFQLDLDYMALDYRKEAEVRDLPFRPVPPTKPTEPEEPEVYSQFKNYIFSMDEQIVKHEDNKLYLSEDNGETFNSGVDASALGTIQMIHVFKDGELMVCDDTKAYYTHDWNTLNESNVIGIDGNPFVPSERENFTFTSSVNRQIIEDTEIKTWGNYTNVEGVAFENINVWYTKDQGQTVTSAIKFGTEGYGAMSELVTRHVHTVDFNPDDKSFWVQTGDWWDDPKLIKGYYDLENDEWDWELIGSGDRFKFGNMVFYEGYAYWTWDIDDINLNGIMKAPIEDIGDVSKHERVFSAVNQVLNIFIGERGDMVITSSLYRPGGVPEEGHVMYYSSDRVVFHRILGDIPEGYTRETLYMRSFGVNAKGKLLIGVVGIDKGETYSWGGLPTVWLDEMIREEGFANAFRPLSEELVPEPNRPEDPVVEEPEPTDPGEPEQPENLIANEFVLLNSSDQGNQGLTQQNSDEDGIYHSVTPVAFGGIYAFGDSEVSLTRELVSGQTYTLLFNYRTEQRTTIELGTGFPFVDGVAEGSTQATSNDWHEASVTFTMSTTSRHDFLIGLLGLEVGKTISWRNMRVIEGTP